VAIFEGATLRDLHEVREILEVEIAALAAEQASEEDKIQLLGCLESMSQIQESPHDYIELDLVFHGLLANATHNPVFLLLLEALIHPLRRSGVRAVGVPAGVERSFKGHRAIYACIVRGDREGSRKATLEHLREVGESLKQWGNCGCLAGHLEILESVRQRATAAMSVPSSPG
jgi:GntR family transcriptional repressor for pyruvate dehydrogenase complex